ncbi:MAG TPA: sugar transferase [Terriglobales bacterium]|nr:sugar transferase [Terriglobales bacterium]
MHSSVGLSSPPQGPTGKALALDLQLIKTGRPRAAASNFGAMVVAAEVIADLATITWAVALGYGIYRHLALGKHLQYRAGSVFGLAFSLAVVIVLMLDRTGAYRRGNSLLRVRETEQLLRVSALAFLLSLVVSFFTSVLFSRWLLVLCLLLVPLALVVEKALIHLLIRNFHFRGRGTEKVLVYGSGCTGRRVFSALTRSPKLGLEPVAFVDDDPVKAGNVIFEMGYERRRSATVVEGPVSRELIARFGVDRVVVAIPSIGRESFLQIVEAAHGAGAKVSFVPSHFLPSDPLVDYQDVDGVLLASFGKPAAKVGYEALKRTEDLLGSLILMLAGAPLFGVLAALIKLDSDGPVLFRQERTGQNGTPFGMYKLRTMYTDAQPYDFSPRDSTDPRITRIGKFLRKTSLDELPQLLNVLEGKMSLVGPRPEMPFIVAQYTERHRQRLHVKPGLTGLWQLSGDRAFCIHENIEYDLYYIQHRNLFMDLAILLHTSIFAMRGI